MNRLFTALGILFCGTMVFAGTIQKPTKPFVAPVSPTNPAPLVLRNYSTLARIGAGPTYNGVAIVSGVSGTGTANGTNTGDVTLGTANGLSLSGQALSLQTATDSVPGAMSAADHATLTTALQPAAIGTTVQGYNAGTLTTITDSTSTTSSTTAASATAVKSVNDSATLLAGRAGGQTLNGGTASGENLTLVSTSHATKGKIIFGTSAYDEVNNRLGIGTTSPSVALEIDALSATNNVAYNGLVLKSPISTSGSPRYHAPSITMQGSQYDTSVHTKAFQWDVDPGSSAVTQYMNLSSIIDGTSSLVLQIDNLGSFYTKGPLNTGNKILYDAKTTSEAVIRPASGSAMRIDIGGTTSSFPALVVNGSDLQVIRADGSTASNLFITGNVGIGTTTPGTNNKLEVEDGHIKSTQTTAPTFTPSTGSAVCTSNYACTDQKGSVTITGTAVTSLVINFNMGWSSSSDLPVCIVNTNSATVMAYMSASTTTTATISFAALTNPVINYQCN